MNEVVNVLGALLVLFALVPALTLGLIEFFREVVAPAIEGGAKERLYLVFTLLPAALAVVAWIIWG
jgi:hypothetical protein